MGTLHCRVYIVNKMIRELNLYYVGSAPSKLYKNLIYTLNMDITKFDQKQKCFLALKIGERASLYFTEDIIVADMIKYFLLVKK